jgi:hypothetical protein
MENQFSYEKYLWQDEKCENGDFYCEITGIHVPKRPDVYKADVFPSLSGP